MAKNAVAKVWDLVVSNNGRRYSQHPLGLLDGEVTLSNITVTEGVAAGPWSLTAPTGYEAPFSVEVSGSNVALPTGFSISGSNLVYNEAASLTPDTTTHKIVATSSTPAATWEWDVPSLQDETDFYTNILGWSIPSTADDFTSSRYTWATGYSFGDVHNDTEGDILWTWDQQYKRYGGGKLVKSGYDLTAHRANVLATFKSSLLSELDADDGDGAPSGYGYDHMYGQGLATIYHDTADSEILTVINGLKTRLQGRDEMQALIAGTPIQTSAFLARGFARWALVTAYCYQAVGGAEWEELRDACVFGYTSGTDWEEGGVIAAGGNFFAGSAQQDVYDSVTNSGQWPYSTYRYNHCWGWGIQNEAMWRLYVQTGNATLRDRLIKSARYIKHYMYGSGWAHPNCGERFGHNISTGARANINGGDSGSATQAFGNCSFDMGVINSLVIGYKLTGETDFLTKAQQAFSRGNRWDPGVGSILFAADINSVYLYVDISANPETKEFLWNKGQLQYCYMLFENGGVPQQVA